MREQRFHRRRFGGRPLPPPLPSLLTSRSSEGPGPVPPSGTQSRPSSASSLLQTCPRGWIGSCLWGWPGRRGPSPPSVLSRRPGCGRRRPHTPSAGPYLRSVPRARPLSHCSEWATGSTWEWLWSCLTLEEVKGGGAPGPGGVEGRSRAGRCHPTKEGALCKPSPVDVLSVHGDATEIHVCTSSRQCL